MEGLRYLDEREGQYSPPEYVSPKENVVYVWQNRSRRADEVEHSADILPLELVQAPS